MGLGHRFQSHFESGSAFETIAGPWDLFRATTCRSSIPGWLRGIWSISALFFCPCSILSAVLRSVIWEKKGSQWQCRFKPFLFYFCKRYTKGGRLVA